MRSDTRHAIRLCGTIVMAVALAGACAGSALGQSAAAGNVPESGQGNGAAMPTEATADRDRPPPPRLRLLPLGEPPPFRQEVRDGIRFELDPPPHSIPPRMIHLRRMDNQANGEDNEADPEGANAPAANAATPLALGRLSPPINLPRHGGRVALMAGEPVPTQDGDGPAPWLRFEVPPGQDSLAILWRGGEDWRQPAGMLLADDARSHPPGTLRFVNITAAEARLEIGDNSRTLTPGRDALIPLDPADAIPFRVSVGQAGSWTPVTTSALALHPGERALLLVFRADGLQPRRPWRTHVLREVGP